MSRSLEAYRWLVSDAARPWLDGAAESLPGSVAVMARLRRELTPDQASLVCGQAELRKRAARKFARAAEMFFTPVGLEQATGTRVAAYKAEQFPPEARVADLCCGIGGDLLALATRGEVVGVDRDPISVLVAEANLGVLGISSAEVRCADVAAHLLTESSAWHIDPDRRRGPQRTTQIDQHVPGWPAIESLLVQCPHAAIKLAPAAELPADVTRNAELEWIGSRRECKQLLVRYGDLARHPGRRTATLVSGDQGQAETAVGDDNASIPHREQIGFYLYEPHAALLAGASCRRWPRPWTCRLLP